jgi:hypothetical protein
MAKMEAAKKGKEDTDDYISVMLDTFNAIKSIEGNDTAAGMLSLLSGGNFESATMAEIKAAQELLSDFKFTTGANGYTTIANID